jgi:hypothetical protein
MNGRINPPQPDATDSTVAEAIEITTRQIFRISINDRGILCRDDDGYSYHGLSVYITTRFFVSLPVDFRRNAYYMMRDGRRINLTLKSATESPWDWNSYHFDGMTTRKDAQ